MRKGIRRAAAMSVILLQCMLACSEGESGDESLNEISRTKSAVFIGSDKVWLVTAGEGDLKITNNAGKDWVTVPGQSVGGRFESTFFINDERGVAVNQRGQVWKSIDGGKTWHAGARVKGPIEAGEFLSANQLKFIDESHGWIVETFRVWRTDDGGTSWREIYSVLNAKTDGQPRSAFFVNNDVYWLATSKGQLYQTRNGGGVWNIVPLDQNVSITDVVFVGEEKGWTVGFFGLPPYTKFYRTANGGKTWEPLPPLEANLLISSVAFINEREGWAAGRTWTGDPRTSGAALLHTLNGGESWSQVHLKQEEPFFVRVYFPDSQHGWLFGRDDVYRTDDTGKSWRIVLDLSHNGI